MIFGLERQNDLGLKLAHGTISELMAFPKQHTQTIYYVYAASVFNKQSSYEIIKGIGEKLGLLAATRQDIIHLETPLLCAGAGGVEPAQSGRALCEGFLSTSDEKSFLFIFANDNIKYDAVSNAIKKGFLGRLWDAIEINPGFGGITVNIKKVLRRE
jgi:hypothetical protein